MLFIFRGRVHPFSVHVLYSKSRAPDSNESPAYLLLIYYRHKLALGSINDLLHTLYRHISLLRKLLKGNTVKQLALDDRAVALAEDPLINKRAPLRS